MYFIGIDLGTSAVKMILCDESAKILNTVTKEYDIHINNLCCEQNPLDWYSGVKTGIKELTKDIDKSQIRAIGTGGQMHGLVMLDNNGNVIREAILWNDSRAYKEVKYLNETIGKEKIWNSTGNIAFAGFTAPKILWVKENEKENFNRLSMILLPKDYITYRLTGEFATDVSDASGMLLFDCKNRCYSQEMLSICGINENMLPKVYESYEVIGKVKEDIREEFGFSNDVLVVAGAGDNAAAAVGMGVVANGDCNISLGTSGTIFVSSDEFMIDKTLCLHSFCHANGKWHLMGCMLSAASCNKWFCESILKSSDYSYLQENIDYKKMNNVYFLPYLMGERCPHNDPDATGAFIGLKLDTSREEMLKSVLEGVAFGIRDSFELIKESGININSTYLCGGGAKSPLWQNIIANVLGVDVVIPNAQEGPSYGGALLSMVGYGIINDINEVKKFSSVKEVIKYDENIYKLYNEKYKKYKMLYPALKDFYKRG